jgi:hypothetical protein
VLDALGQTYVSTRHTFELRTTGKGPTLVFHEPFRFSSGSYSAHLVVRRPADTLIKFSGGSWLESTVGLVNETDEIGVELDQLIPVALAYAYRALRDTSTGPTRVTYEALYRAQVAQARKVHNYDHSNDMDPSVPTATAEPAAA